MTTSALTSARIAAGALCRPLARLPLIIVPALALAAIPALDDVGFALVLFIGLASLGALLVLGQEKRLLARIADPEGPRWLVQVNGMDADRIADHDLAAIEREVFRDPHANLGQLAEILRSAGRLAGAMLRIGPAVAFWAILLVALLDPRGVVLIMTDITATELSQVTWAFVAVLGGAMAWTVSMGLLLGWSPVENRFKAATLDLIRGDRGLGEGARITLRRGIDAASGVKP